MLPNKILMSPVITTREKMSFKAVIFVSHRKRPKMKAPNIADKVQPKKKAPVGNNMKEMMSAQKPEIKAITGPPMQENSAVKIKLKLLQKL